MKKRVIDQEDFDMAGIQSRWKRDHQDTIRIDQSSSQIVQQSIIQNKQLILSYAQSSKKQVQKINQQKRLHLPQIIDQDTQHFKIRLEHLLSVFKTDAVSQFLSMKRSMLQDQRDRIKADTAKYLGLYQQKHTEATQLKQNLAVQQKQNNHNSNVIQRLTTKLYRDRLKAKRLKSLNTCFRTWHVFRQQKRTKTYMDNLAIRQWTGSRGRQMFDQWAQIILSRRRKQAQKQKEAKEKQQYQNSCFRYQKQIAQLKRKLNQANQMIKEADSLKYSMQDNLKKAFMRGVSALNFEAMNVLQGSGADFSVTQPVSIQRQYTKQNKQLNSQITHTHIPSRKEHLQSPNSSSQVQSRIKPNVTIIQQSALQSKQHRWKDATIVGQSLTQSGLPQIKGGNQIQGKVIKVNKGKSFVESKRK